MHPSLIRGTRVAFLWLGWASIMHTLLFSPSSTLSSSMCVLFGPCPDIWNPYSTSVYVSMCVSICITLRFSVSTFRTAGTIRHLAST
uniref:Uncharacterized protein n=1 Tax=Anopheles darlingi TaxID=43151 RepID=A0A2M4D2S0_ANODA